MNIPEPIEDTVFQIFYILPHANWHAVLVHPTPHNVANTTLLGSPSPALLTTTTWNSRQANAACLVGEST
uniref:Uncharacterized protein n=1 Tax=Candidatus Kentrum sp. LPFa TaxID=2126335 RepID=A0A450W0G8_9GAMM|nr:MAG: hypothetical protein BECKLPF1236A_GA0070988_100396 [Candidatus Kentron sp. LPFa]VFK26833.1 MAG: hypothetical protein BECKLPF1236C_GA0070990_100396 [Candidatus Kentron sp. LPFa]